jgi:Sec-independent protein translocase protein TatA
MVLFGGAKVPQLARSLGQARREFEAGQREGAKPKAPTSED